MLPVEDLVQRIQLAEAQGFDSVWLADHAFIEMEGRRAAGHEPLIVLAYAAARTRRIRLGTLVLCAPFRLPGQVAREAAALTDAAGGRFVLGLGAGWHQPEFDALDLPFDHLVSRFEEYLDAVTRLQSGGRVDLTGRYYSLHGAELFATAPAPPIWIAGMGPRLMRLASRLADGVNLAWGEKDPAWMREPLAVLLRELAAEGRDRAAMTVSVGVAIEPARADDVSRLLETYEGEGVDEVILRLGRPPNGDAYRPRHQELAAEALRSR
ncbi:MAG: LLM class flavin-dependent oxidoreductase [Candidatus Dormibacteraeota bacterium]|nr:LLM class flavin-dependent oxidoreductase [Candidatus Dormibacteraeota bacterium]